MNLDFENSLKSIENYVQKYLPIRTQNSITEALVNVLPRANIKRLKVFNEAKYSLLTGLAESTDPDIVANLASYSIPEIAETLVPKEEAREQRELRRGREQALADS